MNIELIKNLMDKKNITQYRLSQIIGLSTGNVSMFLSGRLKKPTLKMAKLIANTLDVTIDDIIME